MNVYEGQNYTYLLRMAAAKDTVTSNMVMYDSIDNYLIPTGGGAEQEATKQKDHDEVESKKDGDGDQLLRGRDAARKQRIHKERRRRNDQLLALVTCVAKDEYRRVVVARRVRDGEDEAALKRLVNTSRKR